MDPIDFGYSMKNIPIPSEDSYFIKLIDKTEKVLKRMRWKEDVIKLIESIKFRTNSNEFLALLKEDIKKIKNMPEVLVSADKTQNVYKFTKVQYNKALNENITKTYK